MSNIAWNLSDLASVERNHYKVFSCFCCAGGSSMGYKLAGFDVVGGLEIDHSMMKLYELNLKPKHVFMMDIREFNKLDNSDLPKCLFNLDILDGSPPCSSFSISGSREQKWGKKSKFREGQKEQVLDDLFFHFIDTAKKLQPKIVIAENVKGLIIGKARGYVKQIFARFKQAGYNAQLFLLDSSVMGVPQKRERVFFIARRNDLLLKDLQLNFDEKPISVGSALKRIAISSDQVKLLSESSIKLWSKTKPGNNFASVHPNGSRFSEKKLNPNSPAITITTRCPPSHWSTPRRITVAEAVRLQTFPDDYDFSYSNAFHAIGMSVPPMMMKNIALQVKQQWLDNLR